MTMTELTPQRLLLTLDVFDGVEQDELGGGYLGLGQHQQRRLHRRSEDQSEGGSILPEEGTSLDRTPGSVRAAGWSRK